MNWEFSLHRGGKIRNPLGQDFFDNDDLLTDTSSLVREAVQNSLDAKVDMEAPVRVRFRMGQIADPAFIDRYFGSLQKHVAEVLGDRTGNLKGTCRYLVVEDFNTEGLRGDTDVMVAPPGSSKADYNYSYFVHHEGEGNKGEGKRGRWGVGKVVFTMISALNTFFAFSVRGAEHSPCGRDPILIGQCTLKAHQIGSEFYEPDGWFADGDDSLRIPFAGTAAEDFAKEWGVDRQGEPGLSIIVPFINSEVGISEIRDAVIRQYFLPILVDELECEIVDESGASIILNSQTLVQVIEGLDELTRGSSGDLSSTQVRSAIKAFQAASGEEVDIIEWNLQDRETAVTKIDVPEDVTQPLAASLDAHGVGVVEVKIPVPEPFKKGLVLDTFEVLFYRDEGSTNPVIFSREGILVPGHTVKMKDLGALTGVNSGPLANLLALAEGPAHEEWKKGAKKFRAAFGEISKQEVYAARCIQLVRNLPSRIAAALMVDDAEAIDTSFFADWFSGEAAKDGQTKGQTVPTSGDDPRISKVPDIPELPNAPRISQAFRDGVFFASDGGKGLPKGSVVRIEFAYATAKGNALKLWDPLDFTLSDKGSIRMVAKGVKIISAENNVVRFLIKNPDNWRFEAHGFSTYRDLETRDSSDLPGGDG